MKICTKCNIEKALEDFPINNGRKDGRNSWCRVCHQTRAAKKFQDDPNERARKKRNTKASYERGRNFIWQFLSEHPCVDCGQTNPIFLEFDHRDPALKTKNIGDMLDCSIARIQSEIDKCDIRCSYCHTIRTIKQFNTWKIKYL